MEVVYRPFIARISPTYRHGWGEIGPLIYRKYHLAPFFSPRISTKPNSRSRLS